VDDAAAAEEEQTLEEGVGHQVEDGRDPGARPECEDHEAELADGRVGDDPLDVVLCERDGRPEEGVIAPIVAMTNIAVVDCSTIG
jgi:hypothetical protein